MKYKLLPLVWLWLLVGRALAQPVFGNLEPSVLTYTAGQAATPVTSSLTVTDVTTPNVTSATVVLSNRLNGGSESLTPTVVGRLTAMYTSAAGCWRLVAPPRWLPARQCCAR